MFCSQDLCGNPAESASARIQINVTRKLLSCIINTSIIGQAIKLAIIVPVVDISRITLISLFLSSTNVVKGLNISAKNGIIVVISKEIINANDCMFVNQSCLI